MSPIDTRAVRAGSTAGASDARTSAASGALVAASDMMAALRRAVSSGCLREFYQPGEDPPSAGRVSVATAASAAITGSVDGLAVRPSSRT